MIYRPDRIHRQLRDTAAASAPAVPPAPAKPKKKKPAPRPPVKLPPSLWKPEALTVILPIPSYNMSPNGRGHWRKTSKLKQSAKVLARLSVLQVLTGNPPPCAIAYTLAYYWPATHRDDDNAIASCKAYLDGIASALGIDDRTLRFRALIHNADRKTPRVEIIMHLTAPNQPA